MEKKRDLKENIVINVQGKSYKEQNFVCSGVCAGDKPISISKHSTHPNPCTSLLSAAPLPPLPPLDIFPSMSASTLLAHLPQTAGGPFTRPSLLGKRPLNDPRCRWSEHHVLFLIPFAGDEFRAAPATSIIHAGRTLNVNARGVRGSGVTGVREGTDSAPTTCTRIHQVT